MTTAPYLHNLTALRGIAALLVVVLHFDFMMVSIIPKGTTAILDKLYLMVDLFFILSGFVMSYVYASTFSERVALRSYTRFLWLRLARIYPLHLATLFAEIGLFLIFKLSGKFDLLHFTAQYMWRLDAILPNLFFLQAVGFHDFVTWNSPAWSLSAEWWSYTIFPALFFLAWRYRRLAWVILPLIAWGGWCLCEFIFATKEPFLQWPAPADKRSLNVIWHYGALRGIFGFVAGMFVYRLYEKRFLQRLLGNSLAFLGLTALALTWMHIEGLETITVSIYATIILSAAYGSPLINRVLQCKPLQLLGDWSFSIYLWHLVLFKAVKGWYVFQSSEPTKTHMLPLDISHWHATLAMLFAMVVVLIVGWLSFTYIEKPCREHLRRWRIAGQ